MEVLKGGGLRGQNGRRWEPYLVCFISGSSVVIFFTPGRSVSGLARGARRDARSGPEGVRAPALLPGGVRAGSGLVREGCSTELEAAREALIGATCVELDRSACGRWRTADRVYEARHWTIERGGLAGRPFPHFEGTNTHQTSLDGRSDRTPKEASRRIRGSTASRRNSRSESTFDGRLTREPREAIWLRRFRIRSATNRTPATFPQIRGGPSSRTRSCLHRTGQRASLPIGPMRSQESVRGANRAIAQPGGSRSSTRQNVAAIGSAVRSPCAMARGRLTCRRESTPTAPLSRGIGGDPDARRRPASDRFKCDSAATDCNARCATRGADRGPFSTDPNQVSRPPSPSVSRARSGTDARRCGESRRIEKCEVDRERFPQAERSQPTPNDARISGVGAREFRGEVHRP